MAEGRDDYQESCSSASQNTLKQTRADHMLELLEVMKMTISEMFDYPEVRIEEAKANANRDLIKFLIAYIQFLRWSDENVIIMDRQGLEYQTLRNNICSAMQRIVSDYPRYREECDRESLKSIIAERVGEVVSMINQSFRKREIEVFDNFKVPTAPAPRRVKRDKSKSSKTNRS